MSWSTPRREFLSTSFVALLLVTKWRLGLSHSPVRVTTTMTFVDATTMDTAFFWTPQQLARHTHYLQYFTTSGLIISRKKIYDEKNTTVVVETLWKNKDAYHLFQHLLGEESDRRAKNFPGMKFNESIAAA